MQKETKEVDINFIFISLPERVSLENKRSTNTRMFTVKTVWWVRKRRENVKRAEKRLG